MLSCWSYAPGPGSRSSGSTYSEEYEGAAYNARAVVLAVWEEPPRALLPGLVLDNSLELCLLMLIAGSLAEAPKR